MEVDSGPSVEKPPHEDGVSLKKPGKIAISMRLHSVCEAGDVTSKIKEISG
jgi:hypothetical protein